MSANALNATMCQQSAGMPVLVNSTGTRACGIRSLKSGLLDQCCTNVQSYQCSQYCGTDINLNDFTKCVMSKSGNDSSVNAEDVFCERGIMSKVTESVKSSAGFRSASAPRYSYVLLVLVLGFFFSGGSAAIIPSLSTGLERRAASDSTTCMIEMQKNYTMTGQAFPVSPVFGCDHDDFCSYGAQVSTGIDKNNRTMNGTSAADAKYDEFFSLLEKKTGLQFPAMSSLEMWYDWNVGGAKMIRLEFTPSAWCMKGTATGCQGILGDNNGTMAIEACGPLFTSDIEGTNGAKKDEPTIQGVIGSLEINP